MPPYTKYTWVDEVLAAAARYNILEDGGSAFKSNMQINLATSVTQAGSSLTASRMNNIESELKALSDALLYKINPSVATNDLTVALTHADGTAPSSTRPLYVRINDTWYSFTAATTYTKNDGTNWHNAGSAELNGNPIDFFLYVIAETGASAGAKIGHSRIAHARTMADFINTTTNEKYIAGNWTNFNSTDKVEVIGRFRAQLSATPNFYWSIASALVIHKPIYETDWLIFTPTITGFSANPTNTIYQYKVRNTDVILRSRQAANGTSNATTFTMTTPFTALTLTNAAWQSVAIPSIDNGAATSSPGFVQILSATNTINVYKDSAAAAWTNANGKRVGYFELPYPIG